MQHIYTSNGHVQVKHEPVKAKVEVESGARAKFANLGPSIKTGQNVMGRAYCRHAYKSDAPSDYTHLAYSRDDDRPYHYHNGSSIYFWNPDKSSYYYDMQARYSCYISPQGELKKTLNPDLEGEQPNFSHVCCMSIATDIDGISLSKLKGRCTASRATSWTRTRS
ncbi:hypothetical protein BDZ97DRAFT_1388584 [Flammula alnicola]|nr:hypothetical protein BDZ97DRAFT_1388584 [Flammula alnicola]